WLIIYAIGMRITTPSAISTAYSAIRPKSIGRRRRRAGAAVSVVAIPVLLVSLQRVDGAPGCVVGSVPTLGFAIAQQRKLQQRDHNHNQRQADRQGTGVAQ